MMSWMLIGPRAGRGRCHVGCRKQGAGHRDLEEVVNPGNAEGSAEFIAPDYLDRYDQGRGIEGAKRHVLAVR